MPRKPPPSPLTLKRKFPALKPLEEGERDREREWEEKGEKKGAKKRERENQIPSLTGPQSLRVRVTGFSLPPSFFFFFSIFKDSAFFIFFPTFAFWSSWTFVLEKKKNTQSESQGGGDGFSFFFIFVLFFGSS